MLRAKALDSLQAQMDMLLITGREMIELAHQGNFGRVAELDQRRTRELSECLSRPIGASEAQVLRDGIAAMVQLHEELVGIVTGARGEALCRINEAQRSQQAISCYSATSS